tara:strand:+ start:180 stop:419 length:240 start_codon:yes stop_codon:yes gene_type:complete
MRKAVGGKAIKTPPPSHGHLELLKVNHVSSSALVLSNNLQPIRIKVGRTASTKRRGELTQRIFDDLLVLGTSVLLIFYY